MMYRMAIATRRLVPSFTFRIEKHGLVSTPESPDLDIIRLSSSIAWSMLRAEYCRIRDFPLLVTVVVARLHLIKSLPSVSWEYNW
jgi:hypothetical protein